MTDELARREREADLAAWAYHKAELRRLALLLGFPNPFPARGERRNGRGEIKSIEIERIDK